ncbi:TIR domain-containing protein [Solibacillus sp. MA9]|uniref:TIR domain-containing protein n=1 Tax=Solibacillus palustris TaxID=2908203 RepID=A0ABS9UHI5_9BACL|nr:TIR domain-containing protein [Solibacillus sp. MA9]MCH7323824.1 TIR domain-containing protein [Solibacillus sp. MA9]
MTAFIPQKEGTNNISKKIFISHSSKDRTICDAFIDLLEGIGLSENVILYSSSSRHGIPGDIDIFEYLRGHLDGGINVYYMLSDNYYQSVYCLNEMGAAWVKQNDSSTFLLPNFTKSIEGVIDNKKKAFTLNNPIDLVYLKNKLIAEFKIEVSEAKWEEIKNKFLNTVNAELEKFKGMQQLESLQQTEQAYAAEQEIRDKILHELEIEKVQVTIDKQAELYEKNAQIDVTKQVFEQILAGNTDVLKNLEQISKPQKQGYKINTHPANKKKRR